LNSFVDFSSPIRVIIQETDLMIYKLTKAAIDQHKPKFNVTPAWNEEAK